MAESANPLAGRAYLYRITFRHPKSTCPTVIETMIRDFVASDASGGIAQARESRSVCEICHGEYIEGTVVRLS